MKMTTEMTELKKWLMSGQTSKWFNVDEFHEIEVSFGETLSGGKAFKVFFNGAFVSITKDFLPMWKKLSSLRSKHNIHRTGDII